MTLCTFGFGPGQQKLIAFTKSVYVCLAKTAMQSLIIALVYFRYCYSFRVINKGIWVCLDAFECLSQSCVPMIPLGYIECNNSPRVFSYGYFQIYILLHTCIFLRRFQMILFCRHWASTDQHSCDFTELQWPVFPCFQNNLIATHDQPTVMEATFSR